MNSTIVVNFFRGTLFTVCALVLSLSLSFGQTFKNGGSYTNTGALSVVSLQNYKAAGGTLINSGTVTVSGTSATAFDNSLSGAVVTNNSGGIIDMTGVGGIYANGAGSTTNNSGGVVKISGSVTSTGATINTTAGTFEYKGNSASIFAGVSSATYANLIVTGATAKSLSGSIVVDTLVTLNVGSSVSEGASNSLTLNGANSITGTGTLTADGTTIYNHSGASQNVYGATYNNLTLQNSGTKLASNPVTVNGTLSNAASTTFDLATNSLTTGASASISNNATGTIQTGGSVSFGAVHNIGGMFKYTGAGDQNVGSANYTNLDLSGVGGKTFPAALVGVSGAYTLQGGVGARTYTGNTFAYNGAAAQSVLGLESYDSLRIVGTADTSVYKTLTTGNLPTGVKLDIAANATLNMGAFAFAGAPGATSANFGKIMWATSNTHVVSGSGTTEFYGTGNMAAGTYGNVLLSNGGTVTIPAATSVTSTGGSGIAGFFILSGKTLNLAAGSSALTVTGQDLDNSGTLTNAGTITVN